MRPAAPSNSPLSLNWTCLLLPAAVTASTVIVEMLPEALAVTPEPTKSRMVTAPIVPFNVPSSLIVIPVIAFDGAPVCQSTPDPVETRICPLVPA